MTHSDAQGIREIAPHKVLKTVTHHDFETVVILLEYWSEKVGVAKSWFIEKARTNLLLKQSHGMKQNPPRPVLTSFLLCCNSLNSLSSKM